tara:strand:- start:171 stop:1253 length:1083 start_codon:yes stop_codon:yes gene_type:complete
MKQIYKYFIDQKNKILENKKNQKMHNDIHKSFTQGLDILNKRKEFARNLSNNLNKINTNKVIEGNTSGNMTETEQKISTLKTELETKRTNYNSLLTEYETEYTSFIKSFNDLKENVDSCKTSCTANSAYTNEQKQACIAGCHLKGPYIQECQDNFNSQGSQYSCSSTAVNQCDENLMKPNNSSNNLNTYKDSEGVSILKGCCACGGGKFGKPKYYRGGQVINTCANLSNANLINICEGAEVSEIDKIKQLPLLYSKLVEKNENMMSISNRILEIVNELKTYNVNIMDSKIDLQREFSSDSARFNYLKGKISQFKKNNIDLLDKRVEDGQLKKSAYDFRNYVWFILAIAFGLAALNKIRNF